MERPGVIADFIKRNKYVVLVVLIGVALMMIPGKSRTEALAEVPLTSEEKPDFSKELANILSRIEGAGEVEVMLTVAAGEQVIYQTDGQTDSDSVRRDTVTVTDTDRKETGLVKQVLPQTYLGAIVVCQGADSPLVRLAVVEAVASVTGLSTDKISVLKMK